MAGGFALYAYVKDTNRFVDPFGLNLVDGMSLPNETKLFRVSGETGIDIFKFNNRELEAISSGKLNPAGISLIRADNAKEAMKIWNEAFPNRQTNIASIKEISAKKIRAAGFDVIHNPSKGKIGDYHARLIHPEGVSGFSDENLTLLTKQIQCN